MTRDTFASAGAVLMLAGLTFGQVPVANLRALGCIRTGGMERQIVRQVQYGSHR
jgi:hypothetical protein